MNSHHIIDRRTLLRCSFASGAGLLLNPLLESPFISAAFAADAAPIVETTGQGPWSRDQWGANLQGDSLRRFDRGGESLLATQGA
jgi:hypothetical protein